MFLSEVAKKIIQSRLYDKEIIINTKDLDNYIINTDAFKTNTKMYDYIVNNYGTLIIN